MSTAPFSDLRVTASAGGGEGGWGDFVGSNPGKGVAPDLSKYRMVV